MKRILFLFACLLLSIAVKSQTTLGYHCFSFNSSQKTAGLWDVDLEGDIIIPETILEPYENILCDVVSIRYQTFYNRSRITSVFIPKSITFIDRWNFSNCKDLEKIVIDKDNPSYDSRDNCNAVIETSTNTLIAACKNTTIPNSVTSIGPTAFYGCELPSIIIPDGVVSIGEEAFMGCKSPSIIIPNSVTSIGLSAFCRFESPSIIIPDGVVSIADAAFMGCKVSSITIHSSGVSFGGIPFDDCEDMTLYVPDTDIEFYKEKFSRFVKEILPIEKVTDFNLTYFVDGKEYKKVQFKYEDAITPEPDPTKKGMTFSGWSEIPEKMPGKDVTVTGTFSWSKVTKDGVIYEVSDTINNNAAVIGNDNASGEVKIISPVKFDYDYSITDIVDFSFKGNTEITSVVIPESVRKIGDEAFYGCKNLAKIELGKSVDQIEPRAFAGIDKLTDITIYAEDVPSTDRTAFENSYIEDYVTLHVPAGSVEKYKAAAPWKNFKEIVAIPDADTDDTDVDVITIKSYGKGTYCSDYDLDFSYTENLKAFIVTGYDHKTNTIWLTRVKSVPAGTGIIVKGTPGDYKVKHVESLSVYANFLVGTTEDKKIKDVEGEMTNFVLSKGEWYRFDGEITLPQGMAYLPLPLSKFAGTRSLIEVYEDNDEGTTEIRTIEQGTVSSEHDVWFNLQGQRVDKPRKGLYIRNGKKVVIK